jgi:RimJ/RimL family protein N-acetyltransferase
VAAAGRGDPAAPIRTERLELRPFRPGDEDAMALVYGDADALRFWGPPLTREEIARRIERNLERLAADGFARWAIVVRQTGELVGDAGLSRTEVEGVEEIELGWVVRPDRWGKGFATEAGAAWRDRAFAELGLHRIVSMIRPDNTSSRRVAEKLGMEVRRHATWNDAPHLMYVLER